MWSVEIFIVHSTIFSLLFFSEQIFNTICFSSFQDKIAKCRYWPLEVVRTAIPSGSKGKKDDDGHVGFHGVVYLDLAPLLYPGVRRIHGAYKIQAYSDVGLHDKVSSLIDLATLFLLDVTAFANLKIDTLSRVLNLSQNHCFTRDANQYYFSCTSTTINPKISSTAIPTPEYIFKNVHF